MADVNTLFNELVGLSKDDAKQLKEMLEEKLPKKEPRASKPEGAAAEGETQAESAE